MLRDLDAIRDYIRDKNQTEIARMTGLSRKMINEIIAGKALNPKLATIKALNRWIDNDIIKEISLSK